MVGVTWGPGLEALVGLLVVWYFVEEIREVGAVPLPSRSVAAAVA